MSGVWCGVEREGVSVRGCALVWIRCEGVGVRCEGVGVRCEGVGV